MINPWLKLDLDGEEKVLDCDRECVISANELCSDHQNDYYYHTNILPEPFYGSPDAPVYLLLANPGFSDEDKEYHDSEKFKGIISRNLNHEKSEYPFYFLNPELKDSPGGEWWLKRVRELILNTSLEQVARGIFTVELMPYHSKKFKLLPESISKNGLFPSSDYSIHLVNEAMRANKHIIVMRSSKLWEKAVPELKTYNRRYQLNSPQAVYLTSKNLPEFSKICTAIQNNT
jgi:hypothetical protein